MSDVTLLRTLARKSPLKFGKFSDLTVQDILNAKGYQGIETLRYYYYRSSKISFCEDVLNELHIYSKDRINKPGKISLEQYKVFRDKLIDINTEQFNVLSEEDKKRITGMAKKEKAYVIKKNKVVTDRQGVYSKAFLMRKNHNHK
jgi:hypothetical protein